MVETDGRVKKLCQKRKVGEEMKKKIVEKT